MANLSDNEEAIVQEWLDSQVAQGAVDPDKPYEIRIDRGWVRVFQQNTNHHSIAAEVSQLVEAAKSRPDVVEADRVYTPVVVRLQRRENPPFWLAAEVERARAADRQRIQDLEEVVSAVAKTNRLYHPMLSEAMRDKAIKLMEGHEP